MSKETSNKITNVNFILTIFVVLIHASCSFYMNSSFKYYSFSLFIQRILSTIYMLSVPTFFAISTYLFFRNFEIKNYKNKIKTRIKTLFVPFIFWSFLFLTLELIAKNLLQDKINLETVTALQQIEFSASSYIKNIILCTGNGPLWYVRDLLILFIVSPLFYFMIKKFGKLNLTFIIILHIVVLILQPSNFNILYWIPFYYTWIYITLNNLIPKLYQLYNKNYKYLFYLFYIIIFVLCCFEFTNYIFVYVYKMFSPFLILLLAYKSKKMAQKPLPITKNSFMIFVTHMWIVMVFTKLLSLIPISGGGIIYIA